MEFNKEKIERTIINDAVGSLVNDDEFRDKINAKLNSRIDAIFLEKADEQISNAVNDAIKNGFEREYCKVDSFGCKNGEPTTIRKELESHIGNYWNAKVDRNGKTAETGYMNDKITRAEWVMNKIVADDFNENMKQHVTNIGGRVKDNLRNSLHETVNELLSGVFKVNSIDDRELKRTGSACIDPKANN